MRRLFLFSFHQSPSTPITSLVSFFLYIVVTPFLIGFETDFLCHSHLGLIWISLLFSFLSEPFYRNDKEDGTLELYYFSAYCFPKILLIQLVGHWVIQISCVFGAFPMLQLLYQFEGHWLHIALASLVLTLMCGIHSCLALGITSSCNSLQNCTTLPTSVPSTLCCTSIQTEGFHVPLVIGYFFLFVALFTIVGSISLQD
uniref:Cytochrome c biogenesis B n=1 Tax=Halophila decipiens TaxID=55459 RepID=A0A1B2ARE6_9LILI|nr:cytochrome c biogenesis B [Halophila decipiens]